MGVLGIITLATSSAYGTYILRLRSEALVGSILWPELMSQSERSKSKDTHCGSYVDLILSLGTLFVCPPFFRLRGFWGMAGPRARGRDPCTSTVYVRQRGILVRIEWVCYLFP